MSVYEPASVPVLVIVTEPVAVSPIFIAAELKIAPEPERLIVSEPDANALDEIVVGVAVKFAKVPPTVAIATTEIAAMLIAQAPEARHDRWQVGTRRYHYVHIYHWLGRHSGDGGTPDMLDRDRHIGNRRPDPVPKPKKCSRPIPTVVDHLNG